MNIKSILESFLFVNERPIEVKELAEILGVEKKLIQQNLDELIQEYARRDAGMCIVPVAGGYQMCSQPHNEEWVRKMFQQKNKQKFSSAALETLAIISYKQPITRAEIEAIRGVNVDGVVRNLLELGLIKEAGRKEVPGRPFLYVTTRRFLEYFGLNSLHDLPNIEEFSGFEKTMEKHVQVSEESPQPAGHPAAGKDDPLDASEETTETIEENRLESSSQEHLKMEG
ncbi:MAG: SMC-Scp complex subunit ScpB [Candidatus Omnitrophica bacterium]|nr:SMC-Scp complex subunit ScpB [Candidatus Omnitrophota bacterium]